MVTWKTKEAGRKLEGRAGRSEFLLISDLPGKGSSPPTAESERLLFRETTQMQASCLCTSVAPQAEPCNQCVLPASPGGLHVTGVLVHTPAPSTNPRY